MLLAVAGSWGGSFLLMAISLDHFAPGLTVTLRIISSIAAVALIPQARRRIARNDWPQIVVLGLSWMTASYVMQALAQTRIDSALTGMLSGAMPIYGAFIAAILLRRWPGPWQTAGVLLGFGGIALMGIPSALDASGTAEGVAFIVLGNVGFALATSLVIPLQRRYGAPAVILHAQLVGLVVTLPYGIIDAQNSVWDLGSFSAIVVLGALQSGIAVVVMAALVGRVGATRGSVTMYFVPITAVVLGVVFRDDSVKTLALIGIAVVLIGAYLATRRDTSRDLPAPPRRSPRTSVRVVDRPGPKPATPDADQTP